MQNEPPRDKTNKMTVRPAKHPPSLIRVFDARIKKALPGSLATHLATAKTLIRLGGRPG